MNPDSASTSSTFPSSDDWRLKNGSGIQRCEPLAAVPIASTRRISASIVP